MACTIDVRQSLVRVDRRRLARTGERALAALGRAAGGAEILVVDDAEIRRLNAAWRGIRRRTDVLALPLETPEAPSLLLGQIVLSAESAARHARRLGVAVSLELDLLLTHGALHLAGWDDRDPVEAALMHERARSILSSACRHVPPRLWRGLLRR